MSVAAAIATTMAQWRRPSSVASAAMRGPPRVLRRSYEPFGGVYARDYALKPRRRQPGLWGVLWAPALAAALFASWQVFHSLTDALIALNIISYIMQCYWPRWEDEGVLTADALQAPGGLRRLVMSSFLHASWYHLGTNMFSLWYIGHFVERAFGPGRFLFVYLGSSLIAALASLWSKRQRRGDVPSVGASGGVFGAMTALLIFRWRHGLDIQMLWITLLLNFLVGAASPEVDNVGHAGGAAGGALIAYLWGPRYVWSAGRLFVRDAPIITWPFM